MTNIRLVPLERADREQFIRDNQEAFNYGALEEFGMRDDHLEEDGQIISRETIEKSIESGIAYRIMEGEKKVGGAVIKIEGTRGNLDLLFTSPKVHSKESAMPPGVRLNGFTLKWKSGKQLHRILKPETFISM